jgi:IS1 family transposase
MSTHWGVVSTRPANAPLPTINGHPTLFDFIVQKAGLPQFCRRGRKTRQGVASALGHRSKQTCRRLWEAIPSAYRQGHCFTDFWAAYSRVIPKGQHTAVGKETGETAHVERWKNTLRQRLACFVCMTLSFSKSVMMHEACLLLFLYRYNEDRAILLK